MKFIAIFVTNYNNVRSFKHSWTQLKTSVQNWKVVWILKKKNISYRMLYLHPLNFSFMKLNNSTNFKNIARKAQNNDRSFSTQNNI